MFPPMCLYPAIETEEVEGVCRVSTLSDDGQTLRSFLRRVAFSDDAFEDDEVIGNSNLAFLASERFSPFSDKEEVKGVFPSPLPTFKLEDVEGIRRVETFPDDGRRPSKPFLRSEFSDDAFTCDEEIAAINLASLVSDRSSPFS